MRHLLVEFDMFGDSLELLDVLLGDLLGVPFKLIGVYRFLQDIACHFQHHVFDGPHLGH